MNYVYKLVGQGPAPGPEGKVASANQLKIQDLPGTPGQQEKNKFASKYENLIKQSTELCRKYTGPHSVLQIFLEKIIACIGNISLQIKNLAKNELQLWKEFKTVIRKASTL
jgi:hypothetical protein